ncbi:M43 family zinc metalloprotease [Paenibacillus caui]|uniref:M43 family zinc metalloprotease n=1 Tax=Paenibacillus caui TaxID=2873927 RepID=UPI001CA82277|nr:M43 family zinc metalloprotease [Paenibacillus caui]
MKHIVRFASIALVIFAVVFSHYYSSQHVYASTVQEVDLRSSNYPDTYLDGYKGIYDRAVTTSSTITSYRLHFLRIATATNDRVSVSSSYNTTTQEAGTIYLSQSGYVTDVWTPWITGSAYVNLITTNDGNVSTGFVIDKIEYNGTSSPLVNSAAFYPNSFSSVSNLSVYQSSSVSTYGYTSFVNNGLNILDIITNANIGFTPSTSSTAQVQISANNSTGLDYFALTQPYSSSGSPISSVDTTTWSYATVVFNNAVMNSWGFSTDNKQKTVTHELGHVLSLKHQDNIDVNSIMKVGKLTITSPSSTDISNLQYRW